MHVEYRRQLSAARHLPEGDSMTTEKAPYGTVQRQVLTWVAKQAPGTEFNYADTAEELGMQKASVSGILRKMTRAGTPPPLSPGSFSGWYRVNGAAPARENVPLAAPVRDADNPIMEVIGKMQSGNLILRDEDRNLWEAQRM
jgi:hypothetical protein